MTTEEQVRQQERPLGAYAGGIDLAARRPGVDAGGADPTGRRPTVDVTRLALAALGTVAVSVVAVSAAVALRRRPVIGAVTMGPGGWISLKGAGLPPLRASSPRPWWALVLRAHRVPCDVLHVDTGWFARDYVCDLRFAPDRFPDPAGMCARLAEQGFRVSLWQWPNYNVASPLFDEGVAGGHLAKRPSGHAHTYAGGYGDDAGHVDFSDPDAAAWYRRNIGAVLDLGVSAIKVDYGEGAPPDARYAGADPVAMRNLYPLLYQRAAWEASVAARGEGEAVLWARAGWAGSQRYPVHWSGDGVARFEDGQFRSIPEDRDSAFGNVTGVAESPDGDLWLNGVRDGFDEARAGSFFFEYVIGGISAAIDVTVRDSGAYPDLDTVAASNGDVYYFSTEYLTPAYAKSLAEWNSVERDMFL